VVKEPKEPIPIEIIVAVAGGGGIGGYTVYRLMKKPPPTTPKPVDIKMKVTIDLE